MLRLLFKVHSVHLKLRDNVEIQVVIRKDQQNIIIPKKAKLVNGVAECNAHAQFFVSQKNPQFDIIVMILHDTGKKLAGVCEINLREWQQSSKNKTTSILQKSADPNAIINFDFMYLSCDIQTNSKKLVSLGELESRKKTEIMKQMQDKFSFLTEQNNRLVKEVANLKKLNQQLVENQQQMTTSHQLSSQGFQQHLRIKSQQIINSQNSINQMKQIIQKIQLMINFYGETQLKQKVVNLLGQKIHHNFPKQN